MKQRYQEERHRRQCQPTRKFGTGDYVVIRNVDTIKSYRGPYVVDKALRHDRYIIKDVEGCQLTHLPYDGVVEANKIRQWIPQCEAEEEVASLVIASEDEEEFHGFQSPLIEGDQ